MSTNFGFGNLTVNGKKIDWDTAKKYDADGDGQLSTSEYNALLKEMDGDGFNGVPAFGSVDGDNDGKITQKELVAADQKVQIGDYVDAYFETMADSKTATTGGVTAAFKTAATAFMNNFITTFLADKNNAEKTADMFTQFQTAFATFITDYQAAQDKLAAAKSDTSGAKALFTAVDDANKNENISNKETAAIKTAAKDYAVTQALTGDYSFLTSLGIKTTQLATLKSLVVGLSTSADPSKALDSINSEVAKLIAAADVAKIVTASTAMEAKTNTKTADTYSVDGAELDYSKIDGYADNSTVTIKKKGADGAKDSAKADIEKLRAQMKAQIQAKCKAEGTNFSEELFTSIFDASETNAVNQSVSGKNGGVFKHSKSSYNVQDLVTNFITDFNTSMAEAIEKLNADQVSEGLPTEIAVTTDLLDDDASKLTKDEKALKELQEKLLTTEKDEKLALYFKTKASDIIDTLSSGLITRMKTSLGTSYSENKAKNVIAAAKLETLDGVTKNSTMAEVVSAFMSNFQTKYLSLKTSTEA